MVYLLKMVIFHVYGTNNQMVYIYGIKIGRKDWCFYMEMKT